jgi:hypothetical protein
MAITSITGGLSSAFGVDYAPYVAATPATTNPTTPSQAVTITNITNEVNSDGTITVVTTYADGSHISLVRPNPNPLVQTSLFNGANSGQLSVLLSAQEAAQNGVSQNAVAQSIF